MRNKKGYFIALSTIACIMIDLIGRVIAEKCTLPIWLDSIGTFIMAYAGGPVCGAIVGLFNNIIYGIFIESQSIYCFAGAFIGVLVGVTAKKKVFETPFKAISFGMILSLICTAISCVINIILFNGMVGNVWGNQIVLMCQDIGIPNIISFVIGQFYIEFLDKLVCVVVLLILIRIIRKYRHDKMPGKTFFERSVNSGILLFATIVALLANPVIAEAKVTKSEDYNEYTQMVYSNEEGLLSGGANAIEQTKDGRIWIGTYSGLYSYDGTRFKIYNNIESIRNVNTLYTDEEGRLWVGTNDNGFTIMINSHVMNVVDEDDGLPSNRVKSIVCDSNGNYYIGTASGLSIVSLSSGVHIIKSFDNIKNINSLTANESGDVVAVTDNAEVYWFQDGEIVDNPLEVYSDYSPSCAVFSKDGFLYVGTTENHVISYKLIDGVPHREKVFLCYGTNHINSFYEAETDELFVCSDGGVGYFDKYRNYNSISTNHFNSTIQSMIIDYQGDIWIASSRLGLLKLCKSSFAELFAEAGVENKVTNAVTKWEHNLYCATDTGLVIIDENSKKSVTNVITEALESIRVRDVLADSKDNLWITTAGYGVFRVCKNSDGTFDIKNFTVEDGMPGMRFRNVIENSYGAIVISGDEGVVVIKNDSIMSVISADNGLDNIKSLCLLEYNNELYIGSDGGGISVVKDGKVVKTIKRSDGLSSNVIMRMVYEEKSEGILVVASNGLNYISKDGEVIQLDKFPYSDVYDVIYGSEDTVWITSSAGVFVANVEELIANQNTNYELLNSKRGLRVSLVSNSWNLVDKNNIYLCSDSGAVRVNMTAYDNAIRSYRMILDSVVVDGNIHEIDRTTPLHLGSETIRIELEPEILNYSLNDPYISYILEGFDTEEKTMRLSEMETIIYSNLKPGSYTLSLSVWDSKQERVLENGRYTFVIENEMYQKWWFKLYVVLVTALIVAWISWFITRTQMQRTLVKQELELEYANKQLKMGRETILSIARAVDAKDSNTSQHSYRVSEYSVAIARRFGFKEEQCENLRQMALLHDIGKIGIPDAILNKPAKLTDEEYKIMKTHVVRGGEILKDFSLIENVSVGAMYHHERYDGKGYCTGLKGEEIPVEARIIGIADAFDAMTANRVYRKQLDIDFVIEELKRCSGSQFDPKMVTILLELIEDGSIDVQALYGKSVEGK